MSLQGQLQQSIRIRSATPDDAALLLDLMLRSWTGTVAGNSSAYRETEATIHAQLDRGGGALVFHDGEPIGGGRYHPVQGPAGDPHGWVEIKRVGLLRPLRAKRASRRLWWPSSRARRAVRVMRARSWGSGRTSRASSASGRDLAIRWPMT